MAHTKQTAQGKLVTGPTCLTQASINSEKAKKLEKAESIHNTSLKRTQKDPTPKKLKMVSTILMKKRRKSKNSVSSTETTTTINTEMMTTIKTTPPTTLIQTTTIIKPISNISITPPIQPTNTTVSTITIPITLSTQTAMDSVPPLRDSDVVLTHIANPTIQNQSLKICETEILDGLDIDNINVGEDIPKMNQDPSKTISFERDEETSIFSRDEELEKPDENTLTTTQPQMAEQIR